MPDSSTIAATPGIALLERKAETKNSGLLFLLL
jgi:hypothetical protein